MRERAYRGAEARTAGKRGDVSLLLDLLGDGDRMTRVAAANELGEMGDVRAVGPLVGRLHSTDELLRLAALKALGRLGDQSAVSALYEAAISDESFGARCNAVEALLELGDRRAYLVLCEMLREEAPYSGSFSPSPRSFRRWALGLIVEGCAVETLPALTAMRAELGLLSGRQLRRAIKALRQRGCETASPRA